MVNVFCFLLEFILLIRLSILKRFEYNDYTQLIERIVLLSKTCSHYIQIDTSQHRYGLDSAEPCVLNGHNGSCDTHIIYMTDFASYDNSRPQLYLSGSLHGDEVMGPNIIIEFIEYYCQKDKLKDTFEYNILKERMFIFTPLINTYGFSHSIKEDKIVFRVNKTISYVDPNRDFPYFISSEVVNEDCMNSITARTVNEIFKEHIIVSAISFHSGSNVIGYPSGNNNHLNNTEYSDYYAFNEIAEILANYSDSEINKEKGITKYAIANITEIIVSLN